MTTVQEIPAWNMKADYVEHATAIMDVLVILQAFRRMVIAAH